jgi:hypothetical protein
MKYWFFTHSAQIIHERQTIAKTNGKRQNARGKLSAALFTKPKRTTLSYAVSGLPWPTVKPHPHKFRSTINLITF